MDFSNIDFTSGGLTSLAMVAGITAGDLISKGLYLWAAVFLVIAGVFVFGREYWKVN